MKQKWIYSIKIMSITFGLASISSWSLAAIQGLHFLHKDWEISCDNTGTCRAAGYQSDQDIDQPVSVPTQSVLRVQTVVSKPKSRFYP